MSAKEISLLTGPVRWGVLGSARINTKVMPFLRSQPHSQLVGHASRDPEKSRLYAREHGFERSFESYEDLIRSPDIDAVYLSLPNSEHFEWARKILAAGKHLLLEKPLVMKREDFRGLADLARERRLLLMEGFMYSFHAQTRKIVELVETGDLGVIKAFKASFHFVLEDPTNIRLRPDLGGGAMWDIGCYICHLASLLFPGAEIAQSRGVRHEKWGVDTFVMATHELSSGAVIQFDTGFECPRYENLEILGSRGLLRARRPFKATDKEELEIIRGPGQIDRIEVLDPRNPYEREVETFVAVLRGQRSAPRLDPFALELILRTLEA